MMKKFILLVTLFIFPISLVYSQNKISVNLVYGNYLSNSENSLQITKDKKFRDFLTYGFTIQKEDLFGMNLMLEYSYHNIKLDRIIKFEFYDPAPVPGTPPFWADMSLISHTFDLDYALKLQKYFSYGFGPSFEIINRIFKIDKISGTNLTLYDKLASSALGVNGFLDFLYPLWESKNYLFLSCRLKLRYTHSIWFDKGIRDLDNYSQEFLTGQISLGLGYSF
jgi:hypothetical protein